jgi:hypothetical protein
MSPERRAQRRAAREAVSAAYLLGGLRGLYTFVIAMRKEVQCPACAKWKSHLRKACLVCDGMWILGPRRCIDLLFRLNKMEQLRATFGNKADVDD